MKWENQFLQVPDQHRLRTTIDLPNALSARLKSIDPKEGVIQITVSLLLTKLIHELDRLKLHGYAADEYRFAVANAQLTLAEPGRAVEEPSTGPVNTSAGEAVDRNDGRGNSSVASKTAGPQELPNPPKPPRAAKSGKGKQAKT